MHRIKLADGSVFPNPDEDLSWRLIHAHESIKKEELVYLAGIVDAYRHLVFNLPVAEATKKIIRLRAKGRIENAI